MADREPNRDEGTARTGNSPGPTARILLGRGTVNLLLLIGVLLAALAAMMPWVTIPGVENASAVAGGSDPEQPAAQGLAAVLAGVLAAGWLLSLTLPTRGKQVVAVLQFLVGVGLAVVAFSPRDQMVAEMARTSLAPNPEVAWWPWLCLPAGILAALGALAMLVGAPRWPRTADRFRREGPTRPVDSADDPIEVWKAMDAGMDPTAAEEPHGPPRGHGSGKLNDGTQ